MLANKHVNLALYVIGSLCTAAAMINSLTIQPYVNALTTFGAALLAVGRWDKLTNTKP